jgi:uncharacterized protein with PQ loop repeat
MATQPNNIRTIKKVILGVIIAIPVVITLLTLNETPGSGMSYFWMLSFIAPLWVIYPVFFTILALKYAKEKSAMDIVDKLTFYVLLAHVGWVFLGALGKL